MLHLRLFGLAIARGLTATSPMVGSAARPPVFSLKMGVLILSGAFLGIGCQSPILDQLLRTSRDQSARVEAGPEKPRTSAQTPVAGPRETVVSQDPQRLQYGLIMAHFHEAVRAYEHHHSTFPAHSSDLLSSQLLLLSIPAESGPAPWVVLEHKRDEAAPGTLGLFISQPPQAAAAHLRIGPNVIFPEGFAAHFARGTGDPPANQPGFEFLRARLLSSIITNLLTHWHGAKLAAPATLEALLEHSHVAWYAPAFAPESPASAKVQLFSRDSEAGYVLSVDTEDGPLIWVIQSTRVGANGLPNYWTVSRQRDIPAWPLQLIGECWLAPPPVTVN